MTHVRTAARGFFHPVGTCAIGRVVDGHGRVYGLDGLVVADASIMPTIPRANTNLSTIALAERIRGHPRPRLTAHSCKACLPRHDARESAQGTA